jgi:hypothetical protein
MTPMKVLVDALRRIAEEPLTGPEKAAVAWAALKKAGKT